MTLAEVARLLAVAVSFDGRPRGQLEARSWHVLLADTRYVDAEQALYSHFRSSAEWLMPVHVLDGVRRLREARLTAYGTYVPPPGLEINEELRIRREAIRRIADGETLPPELGGPQRPAVGGGA